jgi:hypothetical protein
MFCSAYLVKNKLTLPARLRNWNILPTILLLAWPPMTVSRAFALLKEKQKQIMVAHKIQKNDDTSKITIVIYYTKAKTFKHTHSAIITDKTKLIIDDLSTSK